MNIILSNNPMVRDNFLTHELQNSEGLELEFLDTDYMGVLISARDRIHLGHSLVTHPLSGSVKPGETPYKTIIITGKKGEFDHNSLSLIEAGIQTCIKLKTSVVKKDWNDKVLLDFQLIDKNLIFG